MTGDHHSLLKSVLASSMLITVSPLLAADVTADRLINANKEPQNWLMNHRTYDGQRFSPLAQIDKGNVKNLKLAYAVPLGGGGGNEYNQATPLAEDGFLYITDSWGVVYKIDGRSGDAGRIVWRMDPKQEQQRQSRGVALWGNLVISAGNGPGRVIATNKETGKVVWETAFPDIASVVITLAPLAITAVLPPGTPTTGSSGCPSLIGATARAGIGHRDKPHQASSFGLSICPIDDQPRLYFIELGFASSQRLPTVPHSSGDGVVAHQVSLQLPAGGELLRHLHVFRVVAPEAF